MNPLPRRRFVTALGACSVLGVPVARGAAAFPSRAITLTVGYPPGGSTDLMARIVGPELSKRLGQAVVVDNLAGAGGTLGAQRVAASAPDGHTLLLGSNNEMAVHRLINRAARTDGLVDFTPVAMVASQPVMLVASASSQVRSLDQFLASARSRPGKYSYGTSGVGTVLHLTGEMLKERGRVFIVHIPYRGAGPLANDLLGGQLEFAMMVLSSALPYVRSGRLHALGVSTAQRSASAPEVAAFAEHPAFKGFDIGSWFGLWGPARMDPQIVQTLRIALNDALASLDVRKKLQDAGATVADPRLNLGDYLKQEIEKYRQIVKFANIQE